ncbi:hypothetical protein PM3016_2649 [Paenibacillus mucilaginosus 3016]|uniref:Uncharacterized protein n=1 Tax=Paenibacillus mucilaginosus 3016 TaxID=1116391 RepID=H6NFC0_9BACL|nr:hypothetical protein PM3016_2649 [Paenibacillus mucilaginosus 3016]
MIESFGFLGVCFIKKNSPRIPHLTGNAGCFVYPAAVIVMYFIRTQRGRCYPPPPYSSADYC